MHLILMTRGIQQSRDMWKKFMETQWFPFIRYPLLKDDKGNFLKNPDGSYQKGAMELSRVQGSLRPIELWEYIFPSEGFKPAPDGKIIPTDNLFNLRAALAMQNLHNQYNKLRPEVSKYAWLLRKMMHLKKIPELADFGDKQQWEITDKLVPMAGMACYPIGIKEDVTVDTPNYGYWQENI